jgi:hypothetical protein
LARFVSNIPSSIFPGRIMDRFVIHLVTTAVLLGVVISASLGPPKPAAVHVRMVAL